MKLAELIDCLENRVVRQGDENADIKGLTYDSRQVGPGYMFVAVRGHSQDGHAYLEEALGKGASALVAEDFSGVRGEAAMILVPHAREAMARLAACYYGRPYRDMYIIGITGTNGKTSTSYILESILEASGARAGVIGTINYRYGEIRRPAPVTTPESTELMAVLREMADYGVTHVVMEISSHALDQGRVQGCPIWSPVFTNITRDHLDYHRDMESYFSAKSLLFKGSQEGGFKGEGPAVINLDDPRGKDLLELCRRSVISYGLEHPAQVSFEGLTIQSDGISGRLLTPKGSCEIRSSLIGKLNVYNILAACGAALSLDLELDSIRSGVEALKSIPGRLERVGNKRGIELVVDYAHTPDALQKVLEVLRPLAKGRLITVFGCGGDRDRGKRPEMGLTAGKQSDLVVVTSDNPRTEDPLEIISQVEEGVRTAGLSLVGNNGGGWGRKGYIIEPDRRKAIQKAVSVAEVDDMVLIAGKGHEDYQIKGTRKIHFDDREEAALAAV